MIKTSTRRLLAATALVASAAPAHADDAAPLPLVVRSSGGLDADTLRAKISAELGASIALASSCSAPCLEVRVASGRATVLYQPPKGSARAHTVELGGDGAQWPLVVTLLAGNVVRDEASDVLATLPAPVGPTPAPEPPDPPAPPDAPTPPPDEPPPDEAPPAPPAVEPSFPTTAPPSPESSDGRTMFLGFGFVPVLSTDFTQVGKVRHFLSLDIIAGVSGGSSGFTMAGVVDIERGPVGGVQLAGVASIAHRVDGVQIAGVTSLADRVDGVQLAGVASVAGRASTQIAGVAAHASSSEMQLAGVAAHTSHRAAVQVAGVASRANAAGVQIAGVAAVATREANVQIAGVASVTGEANVQIAGVAAVADRVTGLQIATVNVARRVSGVQLGVVNIGGDDGGSSFGLINIVPGGRYDLEGTIDNTNTTAVLFRHGGRNWHNVYGIAGHAVDERGPTDDVWMYGAGFGPSWRTRTMRVDLEALAWQVNHGARHSTDVSILAQGRLTFAYGLGPFALVAGATYNVYISNDQASPLILERRTPGEVMEPSRDVTVTRWPTAFVGLRL